MANIIFQSFESFVQQAIQQYQSRIGVSDTNINSALLSLFETTSQVNFNLQNQMISVLDSQDINRAQGSDLDLIGAQYDVQRLQSTYASGAVTVVDSSFTKISTNIYSGTANPVPGSTLLNVNNGSSFPTTGSVIVGRGTSAVETVPYTSITNLGSYWQITLSSALTNKHAQGDSVILSQGGLRTVSAGTSIGTPVSAGIAQVNFNTLQTVQLLDGENTLTGVSVVCQQTGSVGNIAANSLTVFSSNPFPGATVTNPLNFTNGQDTESDFGYRDRIKTTRSAQKLGITQSILNGVIGLTSPDEHKTIISSTLINGTGTAPAVLYIDDGTGYEAKFFDIGYENIVGSAFGGEPFLQTQYFPISKARLTSFGTQPFNLSGGEQLAIFVGGVLSVHTFQASDFATPGAATTYEVVTSINNDTSLLYSARTINSGNNVYLYAINNTTEDLLTTVPTNATDANGVLVFPNTHQYTTFLYKNNNLLTKDGQSAILTSNLFPWSLPGSSYGLTLSIDGTSNITVTFNSTNLSPYVPSTAPLNTWVSAFNSTIPGITAVTANGSLVISSNKGAATGASLNLVTTSSLLANNQVFSNYSSTGSSSQYSIRRGNGQINLVIPASAGDNYTLGTPNFQAQILASNNSSGAVSITYSGTPTSGRMWGIIDNGVTNIPLNVTTNISISVSQTVANVWRYTDTSGVGAFLNVLPGDIFITYDPNFNYSTTQNNQGAWYVSNQSATWIEVEKLNGLAQTITLSNLAANSVFRTNGRIQSIPIATGNYSLSAVTNALNADLYAGFFDIYNSSFLRFKTLTPTPIGEASLLAADNAAQNMNFAITQNITNLPMHQASILSGNTDLGNPLFTEPSINQTATGTNFWTSNSSLTLTPDTMAAFLRQISVTRLGQNKNFWAGIQDYVAGSTSITIVNKLQLNPFFVNDRLFNSLGYDFTAYDRLFVLLDNNPTNESFSLPTYRNITVTSTPSPTANTFSAVDADAGNISLTLSFGSAFNFGNYRLWGHARGVVSPDSANSAFIVRSVPIGPTGEQYNFGLKYPQAANQAFTFTVNTSSTLGTVDNVVYLPSSTLLTPNYDGTTTFNVNGSGVYSYNSGTTPAFLTMSVSVGTIVNINSATSFSATNQGVYRVTNITQTAFTVNNLTQTQTAIAINAAANLQFYNISASAATATNLVAFVNSSMTQYISAALAVGSNGSGTVNRIFSDFSTGFTQLSFTNNFMPLIDGKGWVKSATLTSSPQFTTETNFVITSTLYSLSGETLTLVPYNTQQLVSFWNTNAFGSLSNYGMLNYGNQGDGISIKTNTFGSAGSVQIEGGAANDVSGSILNGNVYLGSTFEKILAPIGVVQGAQRLSWVQLFNSTGLQKNLGTSTTTVFNVATPSTLNISGGGTFLTQRTTSISANTQFIVEKWQNFVGFNFTNNGNPPVLSNVVAGDFVVIGGNFATQNQGTYRVVNSSTSTFWIQNSSFTPQLVNCSANTDIQFYSADSIMPGDTLVIAANVCGTSNNGTFTVAGAAPSSLTIIQFFNSSGTFSAGGYYSNVQSFDQKPITLFRPINTVCFQEPGISGYGTIILNNSVTQFVGKISQANGFNLRVLNKLEFPTTPVFGINGYSSLVGLVKTAAQTVFGDPTNPTVYPGLLSPGSVLEILPPLIKRIFISLSVRLNTGVPITSVESAIQGAVIGLINSSKIGQPVAFSTIVSNVQAISGVASCVITSPTVTSSNDELTVTSSQKLLILNSNDVSVNVIT